MPHSAKTHKEMRASVCVLCFRKPKTLRPLSKTALDLIEKYVFHDVKADKWSWLPSHICGGCYAELNKTKVDPTHNVKHVEFLSLDPPARTTRSFVKCVCSVCTTGRMHGSEYNQHKNIFPGPVGRPSSNSKEMPQRITVCSACLSTMAPRVPHQCSRGSKVENLQNLVRESSCRTKEKVITSQLKEVFEEKEISTAGGTVMLSTGGTPIQASLGTVKSNDPRKFSPGGLNRLQAKLGVSDNKMNIIGNYLRVKCGRGSVVKLQEDLVNRNKLFNEDFEVKIIKQKVYEEKESDDSNENKIKSKKVAVEVEKTVVKVKDTVEFAAKIMAARGLLPEESVVQIGINDGQGAIKIMLTIKEKEEVKNTAKKLRYSEGFGGKNFKNSGVKKLLVLLVCHTVERHDNLTTLLREINLEGLEFAFSMDLKMVLILCGKQAASCKHPCPYCTSSNPWKEGLRLSHRVHAGTQSKNICVRVNVHIKIYTYTFILCTSCTHVFTQNSTKIELIVHYYVMTVSLKFHKDPSIC